MPFTFCLPPPRRCVACGCASLCVDDGCASLVSAAQCVYTRRLFYRNDRFELSENSLELSLSKRVRTNEKKSHAQHTSVCVRCIFGTHCYKLDLAPFCQSYLYTLVYSLLSDCSHTYSVRPCITNCGIHTLSPCWLQTKTTTEPGHGPEIVFKKKKEGIVCKKLSFFSCETF